MAVSQDTPIASATSPDSFSKEKELSSFEPAKASNSSDMPPTNMNAKPSLSISDTTGTDTFTGEDLDQNNSIPTVADIKALDDYQVFDKEGKARSFRSLYTGPNVARRILLIFVRHFFCGNCQGYLRTLSSSLTPPTLLSLPHPTFIAIIGCGQPSLIPMYASATDCPYPIYADPTKGLYRALNMGRTLELGKRPEYQRKSLVAGMLQSIGQSLKQVRGGQLFKGGDYQQVGGEFLFEPVVWDVASPMWESQMQLGDKKENTAATREDIGEQKHITWCHRMRNTRDHAEIPELLEVLGIDIENEEVVKGKDDKRWSKALVERKGTGFTTVNSGGGVMGGVNTSRSLRSRASSEKLMGTPEVRKENDR